MAGDGDGDGVADRDDRCPDLGALFGVGGAVVPPDSESAHDLARRGLAGCPSIELLGCEKWGDGSSSCDTVDAALARLAPAFQKVGEVNTTAVARGRYVIVVDGLEDESRLASGVNKGGNTHPVPGVGPSEAFMNDGEAAVRTLRGWSRARAAVETLAGAYPELRPEIGVVTTRQEESRRGVRVVVRWQPHDPVYVVVPAELTPEPAEPQPSVDPTAASSAWLGGGYTWAYAHHMGVLASGLELPHPGESRLSWRLGADVLISTRPLYVTRWEAVELVPRLRAGAGWTFGPRAPWLGVALGGQLEIAIGAAPWIAAEFKVPEHIIPGRLIVHVPVNIRDGQVRPAVEARFESRFPLTYGTTLGGP